MTSGSSQSQEWEPKIPFEDLERLKVDKSTSKNLKGIVPSLFLTWPKVPRNLSWKNMDVAGYYDAYL
jgi:hypothetical protein